MYITALYQIIRCSFNLSKSAGFYAGYTEKQKKPIGSREAADRFFTTQEAESASGERAAFQHAPPAFNARLAR